MFNFGGSRSAASNSKYTFSQERQALVNLSPVEFAIKTWFDTKRYLSADVQIKKLGPNLICLLHPEFQKFGGIYSLDMCAYFNVTAGSAQLDNLNCPLNDRAAGLTGNARSYAAVLKRADCEKRMFNPQALELWLAAEGHAGQCLAAA
jgi:hypothetical protein